MIISRANKERYQDLNTELLNDYTKGVNNWPKCVDEVKQLLSTYHNKKPPWSVQMMQAEMAFAQATGGNKAKGNSSGGRSINPNIICHICGESRHIA